MCLSIMKVINTGLGDSKYVPCPLLCSLLMQVALGENVVYDYHKVPEPIKPSPRL